MPRWSRRTGGAAGAEPEFELIDTGVFDENRYFDVEIEYAKAAADDILMQITVFNRAAEAALLHVLPQLWARNIWSWRADSPKPRLLRARGRLDLGRSPFAAAPAAHSARATPNCCSARTRRMSGGYGG